MGMAFVLEYVDHWHGHWHWDGLGQFIYLSSLPDVFRQKPSIGPQNQVPTAVGNDKERNKRKLYVQYRFKHTSSKKKKHHLSFFILLSFIVLAFTVAT